MREIKLRVRSKATNRIVGYEALFPANTKNTEFEWALTANGIDWAPGVFKGPGLVREQSTGLHDKNGKEIYEADVVNDLEGNPYEVRFTEGCFWPKGWEGEYISATDWDDMEVIGNIMENPDLAESGAQKKG